MMRKQILKASVVGGILVFVFTLIIACAFSALLYPAMFSDWLLALIVLAITGFIAGFITVYLVMSMAVKKLVALFMPPPKPAKKP
jgi:hypothetical protein